jgi:hypothetical protein
MRQRPGMGSKAVVMGVLLAVVGCQGMGRAIAPTKEVSLFNGKDLSGWRPVLSDPKADPSKVWSVNNGVLRCEGKPTGYLRTVQAYHNYRLHLEWRWPGTPTNSGVLTHISGPDKVWPRCIECQLQAGSAGDLVLMGGTGITLNGAAKQDVTKAYVILPKRLNSTEVAPGGWNTYDIICYKGTIQCMVNNMLQNKGDQATETAGWIGLQSEGGPIEFRNITLDPVR